MSNLFGTRARSGAVARDDGSLLGRAGVRPGARQRGDAGSHSVEALLVLIPLVVVLGAFQLALRFTGRIAAQRAASAAVLAATWRTARRPPPWPRPSGTWPSPRTP